MDIYNKLFIDGEWVEASENDFFQAINPGTEEVLAKVSSAGLKDVDLAVATSRKALKGSWKNWAPAKRGRVLTAVAQEVRENLEEMAMLLCKENGKTLDGARGEVEAAARYLEYYAGLADKITGSTYDLGSKQLDFALREPLGVTAHIIPWNYPIDVFCRSVAPALAAGNTCVVKPARETTLITMALTSFFEKHDLPAGVLNVIPGPGSLVGDALVKHPDVDGVVFTGSVSTGQKVIKNTATNITPIIAMELGSKCPALAFVNKDNIDGPASAAAGNLIYNTGQSCGQRSRWYVERSVYDLFLEKVVDNLKGVKVGPGIESGVNMGSVVSKAQYDKIMNYIKIGKEEGARLILGGGRPKNLDDTGYFIAPTVFADCDNSMTIVQEEIFGPVLSVIPVDSLEEAVELANDNLYGLSAEIWCNDITKANWAAKQIDAGHISINGTAAFGFEVPFGGVKESGFGREGGPEAILEYTVVKNIWINADYSDK